ncbi:hypothetical protein PITCH_A140031 [uncultured Desulfobacterium sp.]|uniref:Uncharacterized protein n=1 Tax=uncultured Desulfobacterium sp. TaxID=201089 RepID=A0A445MT57_9BACT|nr:hypothetical protein PITCH_A140031 [uncultured Desulfobacterium sp.]
MLSLVHQDENKEEFWDLWNQESEESVAAMIMLRVLQDIIVKELGGKQTRPTVDSLSCPKFSGTMRVIRVIEEEDIIKKILSLFIGP